MFLLDATKANLSLRYGGETITSGSVGTYQARFSFNSAWTGLTKVAVFKAEPASGSRASSVDVSVLLDETGVCTVPWEVLSTARNVLYAGVYGTLDGEIVLPTIWAKIGTVQEGVQPGESAVPPTPDLMDQAVQRAESAANRAEAAAIHQPIIQGGTWWTWDPDTGEYQDTGEPASGGSGGTGNVSSDEITAIKVLDLADYEAIETKSQTTLYLIRG